ncbi:2Fe-2S iron-sulfur cluster-binding protein [Caldimonas tepidiphila]|uniref:2Fe-2S iron-sulfur cluster-binding protein n=1 Tax=Caldimonas tepidiphila TaxID=2315841 RepID=UPI000E5B7AEA|nr:2Fe-2S iron-sulfur cluster binding domain-containing protein [Caldimonas tepidiphila]
MSTTHAIELTTQDGQSLRFGCAPQQTLLDAAAGAGLLLPSQCRSGSCGACHAHVTRGDYLLGEHSPQALSAGAGAVLMCRTQPRSDLAVALPCEASRIGRGGVARREAEIAALEPLSEGTVRLLLRLKPDADGNGATAEFEPGQFAELELPGEGLRRAYSLANTANWAGELEFLIRLQPGGRFSGWLGTRARPGDTLVVHGPQGAFGLRENGLSPRWFVAGGTGLAPMLSMLRRMAEFQEPHEARLYFGVERAADLFALAQIEALRAELPRLQVTLCVRQPDARWSGFTGTPVDALRRDLAGAQGAPDIYLCGPPGLIDAAQAAARELGVPDSRLISERFVAAAAAG